MRFLLMESYHLKVNEEASRRMPGYRSGPMDPVWKTWSRFVDSLRSSFSNRISRQQAVQQWKDPCHTNSIDDLLDKLVCLQWRTGYTGNVVKDKLERSLSYKLAKK